MAYSFSTKTSKGLVDVGTLTEGVPRIIYTESIDATRSSSSYSHFCANPHLRRSADNYELDRNFSDDFEYKSGSIASNPLSARAALLEFDSDNPNHKIFVFPIDSNRQYLSLKVSNGTAVYPVGFSTLTPDWSWDNTNKIFSWEVNTVEFGTDSVWLHNLNMNFTVLFLENRV